MEEKAKWPLCWWWGEFLRLVYWYFFIPSCRLLKESNTLKRLDWLTPVDVNCRFFVFVTGMPTTLVAPSGTTKTVLRVPPVLAVFGNPPIPVANCWVLNPVVASCWPPPRRGRRNMPPMRRSGNNRIGNSSSRNSSNSNNSSRSSSSSNCLIMDLATTDSDIALPASELAIFCIQSVFHAFLRKLETRRWMLSLCDDDDDTPEQSTRMSSTAHVTITSFLSCE